MLATPPKSWLQSVEPSATLSAQIGLCALNARCEVTKARSFSTTTGLSAAREREIDHACENGGVMPSAVFSPLCAASEPNMFQEELTTQPPFTQAYPAAQAMP